MKRHPYLLRGVVRWLLWRPCTEDFCNERRRCWRWHVETFDCPVCGTTVDEFDPRAWAVTDEMMRRGEPAEITGNGVKVWVELFLLGEMPLPRLWEKVITRDETTDAWRWMTDADRAFNCDVELTLSEWTSNHRDEDGVRRMLNEHWARHYPFATTITTSSSGTNIVVTDCRFVRTPFE